VGYAVTARRVAATLGGLLGAIGPLMLAGFAPGAPRAGPQVYVFPIPGSRVASPHSQIVFRGVPMTGIGPISVVGSTSGVHAGTLRSDSDGRGGSFLPSAPFTPGETVTVRTSLNIGGGSGGVFRFTIAIPTGPVPYKRGISAPRVPGDVLRFHSRPDLRPVAVRVTHRSRTALPGDIFLTPWYGPRADGPMIVDGNGGLIWFRPVPAGERASDLRVQRYLGKPVLTWWQGRSGAGLGFGEDVIDDSSYRQLATVKAANQLPTDLHEFEITALNTAIITSYQPVYWDASAIRGGKKRQIVVDSVVQEIDIPTGLLLFQWDSLDHVPVTDSYTRLPPSRTRDPFDYFHVNSVDVDRDGNLIVSGRNTWTIYKIDRHTGAVIWRLGGVHSSFRLAPRTYWAFQHDVRVQAQNDLYITLFDNESGVYEVRKQSGAVKLRLDLKHMTAAQVHRDSHSPPTLAPFAGSLQQLPDHNDVVGWGARPYISEYSPRGKLLFGAHFVGKNASYRAYLLPWKGRPDPSVTPPSLAVTGTRHGLVVYASWNGATGVWSWRVLGGRSPNSLRPVTTARRSGFETAITIRRYRDVAVQALDRGRHVMAQSAPLAVGSGDNRTLEVERTAGIEDRGSTLREADDGSRTRDLRLGKPTLYQLSYVRAAGDFRAPVARAWPVRTRCWLKVPQPIAGRHRHLRAGPGKPRSAGASGQLEVPLVELPQVGVDRGVLGRRLYPRQVDLA
jgi:Arylsulfotransferase (ASST)